MISRDDDPRATDLLNRVRTQFAEFRRSHSGRRVKVPSPLLKTALDALDIGIPIGIVAKASSFSCAALRAWRKARDKESLLPRARELTLVPEKVAMRADPLVIADHRARLFVGSLAIELPVAALTAGLIREIAGALS